MKRMIEMLYAVIVRQAGGYLALIILAIAVIAIWSAVNYFQSKPVPAAVPLPEAITGQKNPYTPPAPIRVHQDRDKKAVGLPPVIAEDDHKKLLATARLKAPGRPYTISAVLDAATGDTTIYSQPEPLPRFALASGTSAAILYGLANDSRQMVRATLSHDLVQVRAMHAGLHVHLDQTGNYFAGGGLKYQAESGDQSAEILYGLKNSNRTGRLAVNRDLLQVKSVQIGLHGHLDTDGEYLAGAGIGYRW